MKKEIKIESIKAREVLDSRGFPTVEVDLTASSMGEKANVRGMVPSGASTGEGEAIELRDQDAKRFLGKGVLKAVENVNRSIASLIQAKNFENQKAFDSLLIQSDGTENKSKFGANAILAVSMAFARAQSQLSRESLFQGLAREYGSSGVTLPVPLMNILNGGKHADNGLNIQEFMIVPHGFTKFSDALRAGVEVFHHLKKVLHSKGLSTGVGDEGGFAPMFQGTGIHEQAIELILSAIDKSGYRIGDQVSLALDCAASEFVAKGSKGPGVNYEFEGQPKSSAELVDLYAKWISKYPILSIEDGLSEHDWDGWAQLTRSVGSKCQLVGDDLFVTNPKFLKKGIESKSGNAILIKLNQIGSVSETFDAMRMARDSKYRQIVSHRSGETEDSFIADLAVATDCGQIKTGSASRTDRLAKYNQLIRIEEELGSKARFLGKSAF